MSAIRPLMPFPPRSLDEPDGVDLAVRLWRECFGRSFLSGPARVLLEQRLALAVDAADWDRAALLLEAFIDSWALAATVEDAGEAWREGAAAAALAVLARASEVVRLARGWASLPHGPWCLPDDRWLEAQVANLTVAPAVETLRWGEGRLPAGVRAVKSEQLVPRRSELARALARGEIRAVLVRGAVPEVAQAQLALGELRLEGSHQRALERFGLAGSELDPHGARLLPSWADALGPAAAGVSGPRLRARCEGRFLPGPITALAAGRPQRVGYLLWDGPVRALAVAPVAVAVLHVIDGQRDTDAVASQLGGPPDQVQEILDELVGLGAASAVG